MNRRLLKIGQHWPRQESLPGDAVARDHKFEELPQQDTFVAAVDLGGLCDNLVELLGQLTSFLCLQRTLPLSQLPERRKEGRSVSSVNKCAWARSLKKEGHFVRWVSASTSLTCLTRIGPCKEPPPYKTLCCGKANTIFPAPRK